MNPGELVQERFRQIYGARASWLVRAPGRVNLIGDHTDYNQGYVLPMAIEQAVWVALQPRSDSQVRVTSLQFDQAFELDLNHLRHEPESWRNYLVGVAWVLKKAGHPLSDWEGVVGGDLPMGSGLSSSAAFELAMAASFSCEADWPWEPRAIATLMQAVENDWIGVSSGIMDPLVSASARQGSAALIDCRALDIRHIRVPKDVAIVILDTGKRRGLVDSAYNQRRMQCELAAKQLEVESLRAVDVQMLAKTNLRLAPPLVRRVRHVVTENQRVLDMAVCLEKDDLPGAGALMEISHRSLRDDFEVSSPELDAMVAAAQSSPGCYGARMTGAGFGGCAVALVEAAQVSTFRQQVEEGYFSSIGIKPHTMVSTPTQGVEMTKPG